MMNMKNITASIEASMEKWAVPGLAIGILADGVLTTKAFGVQDLETGAPVTSETMFGIGSISKVFTSTLAVKLAEDGRMSLDTPIRDLVDVALIPNVLVAEPVTIRHLLSHTSGLDGDGFADFGGDEDALKNYIASLRDIELLFSPGEAWSYANTGSCIAGFVLATVTSESYESLMHEHILAPLALERTGFGQAPMPENVATGYNHGPDESPDAHPAGTTWRAANPAGGMVSTVHDLIRFAAFHLGSGPDEADAIINRAALASMQQTAAKLTSRDRWGVGWALRSAGDVEIIEHGGWMDGYRAQLTAIPSRGSIVAILNNGGYGHAANEEILKQVLEDAFGIVDRDPEPMDVPESTLKRFEGRYKSSHIDITIRLENGELQADYKTAWHENDGSSIHLAPVTPDELVILDGEFKSDRIVLLPAMRDRIAIRFLNRVLYRDQ